MLANIQAGTKASPLSNFSLEYEAPNYPYSFENYKNNYKGFNSIMFKRRVSCNHYRHTLEPSDLKLRKIFDISDPNFNPSKESDLLNTFNRPIDDHLETWGFLYKHAIIRNKTA